MPKYRLAAPAHIYGTVEAESEDVARAVFADELSRVPHWNIETGADAEACVVYPGPGARCMEAADVTVEDEEDEDEDEDEDEGPHRCDACDAILDDFGVCGTCGVASDCRDN